MSRVIDDVGRVADLEKGIKSCINQGVLCDSHVIDEQHRCMGLNSHGVSKVSVIDTAGCQASRAQVIECLRQQMRELIELERSKLLT